MQNNQHLVKELDITRRKLRVRLLECDFVLQNAQVKEDVEEIRCRNAADYKTATSISSSFEIRTSAWTRLGQSKREIALIVEKQCTLNIENILSVLEGYSRRVDELKTQIRDCPQQHQQLVQEYCEILKKLQETPTSLRNRIKAAKDLYCSYKDIKQQLIENNFKLVSSIASRYQNKGMSFADLFQEGTIGLMLAVDKFEYRRGFQFSTFAMDWIKQGITRAIANQSRLIRLPCHLYKKTSKIKKVLHRFQQEQRTPTIDEIAKAADVSIKETKRLLTVNCSLLSLDKSISTKRGNGYASYGDLLAAKAEPEVEDADTEIPADRSNRLNAILESLNYRELEIIKLRYGLGDGYSYTLEEVGSIFKITGGRVQQIEASVIKKLQQI